MELNSVLVRNCQKKQAAVGQTCSLLNIILCHVQEQWGDSTFHIKPCPASLGIPLFQLLFKTLYSLLYLPNSSLVTSPSRLPSIYCILPPPLCPLPLPSTSITLYLPYPSQETQNKEKEIFFFLLFDIILFPLYTELPCR